MTTLWSVLFPELKGVSLKKVAKHLYRAFTEDAVTDTAAQLSYYLLFSLFPFLFFLVTLLAYLPLHHVVSTVMDRLRYVMPPDALAVIQGHLHQLFHNQRPKLLSLGLVVTIWTASRGVDALRKGLNLAYDVTESRSFWRTQTMAIAMTLAGELLIIIAVAAFLSGGAAGQWLADRMHVGHQFATLWSWLRWPFTAMLVMFAAALGYYVLPDVQQKFRYITPGSVAATGLWLASTWAFTQYVEHFGRFEVTYGSIGGVIVLMVWLYISGLVFLIGGEVNAVIEHESPGGKEKGARAEGEAPLPPEERPSAVPQGAAKLASTAERVHERRRWQVWKRRPKVVRP